MDQSHVAEVIEQNYHPGNKAFTRVPSQEMRTLLELPMPLPEDIWQQWEGIEEQLAERNLIMFPPLPEAREGEDVRVYRKNAPLTQLLEAMLFPAQDNDAVLARAISALNPKNQNSQPAQVPHHSNGTRTNGHDDRRGEARPQSFGPSRSNGSHNGDEQRRDGQQTNGHHHGGGRRRDERRYRKNGYHPDQNRQSQMQKPRNPTPDYQEYDRRANRPLA